jgi:hypothetical protein
MCFLVLANMLEGKKGLRFLLKEVEYQAKAKGIGTT